MALAGIYQNLVEVDIVASHPTAIQPQYVEAAIVGGQLGELIAGECLIVLPPFGVTVFFVVLATVGSGIVWIPKPFAVPVGFREIAANPEVLLAECLKHVLCHVATRIVAECCFGYREIGVFRVVHAKAIVMLGGENHILHTGIVHDVSPLRRVESHGVKHVFQPEIPFLVFIVGDVGAAANPVNIFRADAPALYDAGHAIQAPVEYYTKLQVTPLVEFLQHLRVGGPLIGGAATMHLCADFLCRHANRYGCNQATSHA